MKFSSVALLVSLLGVVVGQLQNVSQILQAIPSCAEQCIAPEIIQLKCNLTTISILASCVCPNIIAQRNISACVQRNCKYEDQIEVVELNYGLCVGYPVPSRSEEMENAAIALLVVVIAFILMRLYAKITIVHILWWDDYTIIVAAIFAICIFALEIPMAKKGFGKHIWTLHPEKVPDIQLLFYISQIFYVLSQVITKISLILLYIRIFPQRIFRYAAITSITIIGVHGFVFVCVVAFQCIPIYSIWHANVPAHCLNKEAIVLAGSVSSIYQDILVLVLPIPCIKSLQIKTGKRASLLVMFSMGSFACVTSIIRLRYVVGFGDYTDATYDNVDVFHWSCIEIAVAIICTCLPAVRNILSRLYPKIFGSLHSKSNTKGGTWGASEHHRIKDIENMDKPIVKDTDEFGSSVNPSKVRTTSPSDSERYEMSDMIHGRALGQVGRQSDNI